MILQAAVQVLPPGTSLEARNGVKPSKAAHQLQAVGAGFVEFPQLIGHNNDWQC